MARAQTAERPRTQAPPQEAPNRGALALQQDQRTFMHDLDAYAPNFVDVLPDEISLSHFRRVVLTAVSLNPDLLYANRRSLFNSCMRAAFDGLLPDGREAALVVYNTEVKQRNPETGLDEKRRVDMVQYLPMVAGLRKRMHNTGEVLSAIAEAVWSKDKFRYSLGDRPFIEHEAPPLNEDRGDVVGAYAIIRLANGEIIRDVMGKKEIEAARAVSRGKDGPMWRDFYWEGAKKTVLRRASKQAPLSASLHRLMAREDEDPEDADIRGGAIAHDPAVAGDPEPRQPIGQQREQQDVDNRPVFEAVDVDGVITQFRDGNRACQFLAEQLDEAASRGLPTLEGIWESNFTCVELLEREGFADGAATLSAKFADLQQELTERYRAAEEKKRADAAAIEERETAAKAADQKAKDEKATAEAQAREKAQQQPSQQGAAEQRRVLRPAPTTAAQDMANASDGPGPYFIDVPEKGGKKDYRVWAIAKFAPKMRRLQNLDEVTGHLRDNADSIEAAKRVLDADDKAAFEAAINGAVDRISAPEGREPGQD